MQLTLNEDAYTGLKLSADWINELESSDSRLHKERVIEKALMAAKLGSSSAQCFLFNCYQTYNPYYTFNIRTFYGSLGTVTWSTTFDVHFRFIQY